MNRHITRESEMLRKARVKLGYSQQQVATMAGMQIRQYQRFEYGEREVYDICGWDEGLNYKVPATVRTRGSETILFFDLDNYIGTEPRKNVVQEEPTASETKASSVDEDDETRGIFYAPDDDAPQEITDALGDHRHLFLGHILRAYRICHVTLGYSLFSGCACHVAFDYSPPTYCCFRHP